MFSVRKCTGAFRRGYETSSLLSRTDIRRCDITFLTSRSKVGIGGVWRVEAISSRLTTHCSTLCDGIQTRQRSFMLSLLLVHFILLRV